MSTEIAASSYNNAPSPVKAVLLAGFTAGTLDIIAAITSFSIKKGMLSAEPVLKFIATGIFGRPALKGGGEMVAAGLLFHYIIAFCFTIAYFLLYPHIPFLRKYVVISGLLYGIVVWVIMNRVVLPLSLVPQAPFKWSINTFIQMGILMVCIGLPVALITHWYYKRKYNTFAG